MNDETDVTQAYLGEAQTGVNFTAFAAILVFFFIGLLLTGDARLRARLRIPLYYLFISAYGFLYSTLLYANASGVDIRQDEERLRKHMYMGDLIGELFGLYFLVLAIPMLVYGYTSDLALAVMLLITGHFAFFMYHHHGYSVLEGFLRPWKLKAAVAVIILLNVLNFVVFYQQENLLHYVVSGTNGTVIVLLFALCYRAEDLRLTHLPS